MRRRSVYIAGPMRGYPLFNFPLFNTVAEYLAALGWDVVNPAAVDVEEDGLDPENPAGEKPFAHYMRRDIELLLGVEAVAFLPAWQRSEGSRVEYTVAKALGLDLFDAITLQALDPRALKLL